MTLDWQTGLVGLTLVVLLAFGVRWGIRRWNRQLITNANRDLQLPIPAFSLLDRRVVIDRLLKSPQLQELIEKQGIATGTPVEQLQQQCRHYAHEMVPSFKALFYFRVGYWLARSLLLSHYHVHTRLPGGVAMEGVDPGSSVVLVMNHRSNMDVLLINFVASHRSTLMHAAGEWARLWPLHHLVRMAGNYVVDRDSEDPLYRGLLKAFVQMAAAEGAHLALFPEGELTHDGRMQAPKFGLLNYIATAGLHGSHSDIYFIPVGLNYDYVPEENTLAFDTDTAYRERGKLHLFVASICATGRMLFRVLRPRRAQFGHACASFGQPQSLRAWQAERGIDTADAQAARESAAELGSKLMAEVAALVPVLPTHALAKILVADPQRAWPQSDLCGAAGQALAALRDSGAVLCVPADSQPNGVLEALGLLAQRRLVLPDGEGAYKPNPETLPVLNYLANSIAHHGAKQGY